MASRSLISTRLTRPAAVLLAILLAGPPGAASGSESPTQLDPLDYVTTATRTERLLAEAPVRTELLTPEVFRASGSTDLASALAYLPGAQVEANCQNCGTAEVKLLGLGAAYNQLLFDQQPLFGGLAAVYGLEHIPTAFLDRIEVVKGGASTLYGPGAVAGVINLIPREPVTNRTFIEARGEVFAGEPAWSGTAVYDWAAQDGSAATSVYGEVEQASAIDLNDDGFTDVTERDFATVGTHAWIYPTGRTRISANYGFTWEERRGGDRFDRVPHQTQITEQLEHRWHRGGLTVEQDLGPDRFLWFSGSVSHLERDSYYGGVGAVPLPGQPGYDPVAYAAAVNDARLLYGYTESTRLFFDTLGVWNLGDHVLSFGAQYKHDAVFDEKRDDRGRPLRTDGTRATASGEDPIADGSFNNLGFFIQDEWDPTRDLCLITGLRIDRHSALGTWVLSPRAAIRYNAGTDWVLRASVSTGFRAPEIFNEDFHIEILDDPTRTRNAPGLKEESSVSWAAGFVYTPAGAGGRLQADVEVYRTEIDDTFNVPDIILTDLAGNPFKQRINAGGSVVQGVEANILYRITDRLSLESGVTFNDATFDEAQAVIPGEFENRYLENPRWSGVSRLTYTNEDLVDLFLGVVWTGPMITVNEEDGFLNRDTPHFFVVDLSATRHLQLGSGDEAGHLDLTIGVRNLFDQRQDDLTSGPGRDAGYFYGPRFPRSFFVSGTYTF